MSDEILMGVVQSGHDLLEETSGFILGNVIALDIIIELSALSQLHYNENIVSGVQNLIQFDDVGVVDEFEYLDLSFYLFIMDFTLDIMFLFFILRLLRILTATLTPVKSCLASICGGWYI